MRALRVEPEYRRGIRQARAAYPEPDPVLDRRVLDLAHAEDVAGLHRAFQQHRAVVGNHAYCSRRGNFEGLVVRAVLLGLLRHQPHVRHIAHRAGVERAVRLTVLDDRLIQARVAAIRDHGIDVVQLSVGAPHVAAFADHRRHRRIDDHIARHVQVGDPPVGIDHGEAGPGRVGSRDVGLDRCLFGVRQCFDPRQEIRHAVVGIGANTRERGGVLLEHIGEEDGHGMTEQDGIGDLHHGRLQVQREQHAVLRRGVDLLRVESAQRLAAHRRSVDDLAGL